MNNTTLIEALKKIEQMSDCGSCETIVKMKSIATDALKTLSENKVSDNRIDKAIELLRDYEQWEADLISDNSMWWPYRDKDAVHGKTYDKMLVLQEKRNKVLQSLNQ